MTDCVRLERSVGKSPYIAVTSSQMAEAAIRHMTLAEFLRWEDGTDTRYELIDGFPMAMALGRLLDHRIGSRTWFNS